MFAGAELPANIELHFDLLRSGATIALDFFKPSVTPALKEAFRFGLYQQSHCPDCSTVPVSTYVCVCPSMKESWHIQIRHPVSCKPSTKPTTFGISACRFVEDADLWTWKLPDSREFNAGISALNLEYDVHKNPDIFQTLQVRERSIHVDKADSTIQSEALTQFRWNERFIDSCKSSCFHVQLGGPLGAKHDWGTALAVQIDSTMSKHRSRLGNSLAEMAESQGLRPIAVVAYREKEMEDASKMKLSLRGKGDATDTTPIAEAFGGGGHRLASSCIVTVEEFNSWRQAA
eukprot:363074-Chlamydomonas_euryale.AAC.2